MKSKLKVTTSSFGIVMASKSVMSSSTVTILNFMLPNTLMLFAKVRSLIRFVGSRYHLGGNVSLGWRPMVDVRFEKSYREFYVAIEFFERDLLVVLFCHINPFRLKLIRFNVPTYSATQHLGTSGLHVPDPRAERC